MTEDSWTPRRRRVLRALGASAAATSLAGCSGGGDDDSGSDDSGDGGDGDDTSNGDDGTDDGSDSSDQEETDDEESDEEESEEESRPDPLGETAWPMGGFDAGFSNHHRNAAALDQPLTEEWVVEKDIETVPGWHSFPIVAGAGHLITATPQGTVIAFDEADGTENWTFEMNQRSTADGGIALFDGVVYASARAEDTTHPKYALDVETGDVLWERDEGRWINPLVYEGRLYGRELPNIVVRDIDSGEERWRDEQLRGSTNIAVSDGRLLATTSTNSGWQVVALDAESGRERWRSDSFAADQYEFPSHISAGGGSVYVTNENGAVISIRADSGDTEWESTPYTEDEVSTSATKPRQPPVIGDDHVFVAGSFLYALSQSDGAERWAAGTEFDSRERIGFVDGQVFNMFDPGIVAHDPADGAELWSYDLGRRPGCFTDFAVTGDRFYLSKDNCGAEPPEIIALSSE